MNTGKNLSIKIEPVWDYVDAVHKKTLAFLKDKKLSEDLYNAIIMAVTELVENAVKYGKRQPGTANIAICLEITDQQCTISVSNESKKDEHLKNVIAHINQIKSVKDPVLLYSKRLTELFNLKNKWTGSVQLGLYRIAFEGKFHIDYTLENNFFTITLARRITDTTKTPDVDLTIK